MGEEYAGIAGRPDTGHAMRPKGSNDMAGGFGIEHEARAQALAHARTLTLPVTARSLTGAEIARIDGRSVPILLGIFFAVALPLLVLFAVAEPGRPGELALAAAVVAGLGALLWLIGRRRASARSDYRDPQTMIELGTEAITLRAPGRLETLAYADAQIALEHVTLRNTTHFLGLVLQTPLGPLRLDDLWFKPGRNAAAALVGRLEAEGVMAGVGEWRRKYWGAAEGEE